MWVEICTIELIHAGLVGSGLSAKRSRVCNALFVSHCSPSLSTLAPPLTVENVCEAVQGVKWTVLGLPLIGFDKCLEFEDTSNENHLWAVVECWLGGGGHATDREPSWRRLIWTLDDKGQTQVADKIRHFAEPVLGKSCDSISVSTFLYSVCLLT